MFYFKFKFKFNKQKKENESCFLSSSSFDFSNLITIDPSSNLSSLIRCTNMLIEKNFQSMATSPISIPTNRLINEPLMTQLNEESNKTCNGSPTNSSRSTVVRSQSSLSSIDVESTNESSNTILNENQINDNTSTEGNLRFDLKYFKELVVVYLID